MLRKQFCIILLCIGYTAAAAETIHPVIIPPSSLMEASPPLTAEDEVLIVARLIGLTEDQLTIQKRLQELMVVFQRQKDLFMQGNSSRKLASQMVGSARDILEIIADQRIQYLFSPDYLDELQLFSSIAGKNGIRRP